ncbi:MAG: DNA-3-methyladenine glycosylase I [Synergistaceae bacterium]|nr:DNA-3-methyladenine glycosylase I [Synergistaceae bacterium]
MTVRCPWAGTDPLYVAYHDEEWGVPLREDRKLFEFLLLEGAQAGLSWITILRKREAYRKAFSGFDAEAVAAFGEGDIARLLEDRAIVRNRRKIESAVTNARAFLAVVEERGSFSSFLWDFVDGRPIRNRWRTVDEIPPSTPLSEKLSRELKSRGFAFVGPTLCYAFMQATGMVNDHLLSCFRRCEILCHEGGAP